MDLVSNADSSDYLKKNIFNIKGTQSDGLMLQIHSSFTDVSEDSKSYQFICCSFSINSLLAVFDSNGNVYVIDLQMQKYWQIPNRGIVSIVSFPQLIKTQLLIAIDSGIINMVHIETGKVNGVLKGHSVPVNEISYSHDGKYCLTANPTEAIIWDISSHCQTYKLSLKDDMSLKKVLFMPVHNNIFACFHDDAIHIWKYGSFECIKQIVPESWKTHHLKSVAFTKNGRAMVIGGCTPNIVVFCLDIWTIKKIIELPHNICGIKYLEFVPEPFDGGANKILGIVTNSFELCFVDIDSSLLLNNISTVDKSIENFSVSPTGKYMAIVLTSGEVNVYSTQQLIIKKGESSVCLERAPSINDSHLESFGITSKKGSKSKQKWMVELSAIQDELKQELTLTKLMPILKQFGEYPESYRTIIWKTILQLPVNQEAFISLAGKEYHSSYLKLESNYPLVNKALCNALKRVLSCLAYWCPLFGEVAFLPEFVFPFVKLFHFDPFACFEVVVTIIVNWCQNWFEFYPFPPINVLSIVENILAYHDPDLLEFYFKKNVTSCSYACVLMQTAFSEVLTKNEWLRLWDHILSNELSFIFMAVVAYNIICRNLIKNCENIESIEAFFHNQHAIDMKLFISKCYQLIDKTPTDIHPRQHMTPFSPLTKGTMYVSYEGYPKLIVDRNTERLQHIQKEEQNILQEQRKAIAIRRELDKKLKDDHKADFQDKVLIALDKKFRQIVSAEEERISNQRMKLQNLRHELKLKELAVLEEIKSQLLKKKSLKKEMETEHLLNDIAARKAREKSYFDAAEEEIRKYYSNFLLLKYRLKVDGERNDEDYMKKIIDDLNREEDKLEGELNELQNAIACERAEKNINIACDIGEIKDNVLKLESEIARDISENNTDCKFYGKKTETEKLWRELHILEKKLQGLYNIISLPCRQGIDKAAQTETTQKRSYHTGSTLKQRDLDSDKSSQNWTSSSADSDVCVDIGQCRQVTDNINKKMKSPNFLNEGEFNVTSNQDIAQDQQKSPHFSRFPNYECENEERNRRKLDSNTHNTKFRTKFTDCSKNRFSSVSKLTDSSESLGQGDLTCLQQSKIARNSKFPSRRVFCDCSNGGNYMLDPKNIDMTILSREEATDCYESEISSSSSCDCYENSVLQKALSERQQLIDEAKLQRNLKPLKK